MIFLCYQIIITGILISFLLTGGCSINFYSQGEFELLHESKLIMSSLEEAMNYLTAHPESVTGDVVLGILIAKANLKWIYDRLKFYYSGNLSTDKNLERLLSQCRVVIEINKAGNCLLNESLWENSAENLIYGLLSQRDDVFLLPKFDSCQSIDAYMMKGTLEDSELCVNELLNSRCKVSEKCWLSEVNGDSLSGYKTSHQLLYFQIAFKMKCNKINPRKFSEIITIKSKLCQQMLLEAQALFKDSNLSLIRDLFMEQIALCGLEGHEEFAIKAWRDRVRSWQNFKGCYGVDANFKNCSIDALHKYNDNNKIKRTDSVVDDCHTHVTAVAISALAFFLRVTLKLAFNLP